MDQTASSILIYLKVLEDLQQFLYINTWTTVVPHLKIEKNYSRH